MKRNLGTKGFSQDRNFVFHLSNVIKCASSVCLLLTRRSRAWWKTWALILHFSPILKPVISHGCRDAPAGVGQRDREGLHKPRSEGGALGGRGPFRQRLESIALPFIPSQQRAERELFSFAWLRVF